MSRLLGLGLGGLVVGGCGIELKVKRGISQQVYNELYGVRIKGHIVWDVDFFEILTGGASLGFITHPG